MARTNDTRGPLRRAALAGLLAAAALGGCAGRPPPPASFLKELAQEGYTPNPGLSGLIDPGNIIQHTDEGADGKPRPLTPPLVVGWASDCFPDQLPREGPFAVASSSGGSKRALGFELEGPDAARLIPGLSLDAGSVSQYRVVLKNPRLRAFAKMELANRLSPKCSASLAEAIDAGDRPEWFSVVIEAVVVDSLSLVLTWNSGITAEVRARLAASAAQTMQGIQTVGSGPAPGDGSNLPGLSAGGPQLSAGRDKLGQAGARVRVTSVDEANTAIDLAGNVIIAYRARSIQPRRPPPAPAGAVGAPALPASGDLRERFRAPPAAPVEPGVARLALRRLEGGAVQRVRMDHPFRSGDAFQLEVSSNRSGWIFLLHAAPGGQPSILWPRPAQAAGRFLDSNEIRAFEPLTIPPGAAALRFDDSGGPERFWVVVRPDPAAPLLGPAAASPTVARAAPGRAEPVQFTVRGRSGAPLRGVVLEPAQGEPDPAVYFTAAPGEPGADSVFEFQLTHLP